MQWWPIAALMILLAGSFWVLQNLNDDEFKVSKEVNDLPDHTLQQFSASVTDNKGRLIRQLQGQKMQHYPVADTEVIEPYLVLYDAGKPSWYVRAEKGLMSVDGERIRLIGKTWCRQHAADGAQLMEITTRDVLVKPDENYLETRAAATLATPRGVTHTVGLKAYLNTRQYHLLSQVDSTHENH